MLNIIQVVQLPVSNFSKVVGREPFLGPDEIMRERMVGGLPALAESMEWARRLNPQTPGFAGAEAPSPIKLIVCVNGGVKEDVVEIEGYLKSLDFDWMLIQQDTVEPEALCVEICSADCIHEFTALVPGHVIVREEKWFEKLQMVFYRDRNCGMVGTDRDLLDNTSNPYRLRHNSHPSGSIALLRKSMFSAIKWDEIPKGSFLPEELSKQIVAMSGNVWVSPSVRFSEQQWESQQQDASATTIPSE